MAGRPRLYENAAEKTRAYREREAQRYVMMDRLSLEEIQRDLLRLRLAVFAAQKRDDPLVQSLRTVMMTDLMEDLAIYFETGELRKYMGHSITPSKSKGRLKKG